MNGFVNFITPFFWERGRGESEKNAEEVKYAMLESWMLFNYRLFPTNKLSVLSSGFRWMKSCVHFDFWGILTVIYFIFEVVGLNLDMHCLKHSVVRGQAFGCHFIPHLVLLPEDLILCPSLPWRVCLFFLSENNSCFCLYIQLLIFWFLLHDIGKNEGSWSRTQYYVAE